jgi:hypothetical protein
MKEPCLTYVQSLGELGRFQRREQGSGLLYSTSAKALSFYNKVEEMKHKRETLPKAFQGLNVLRYEIQFRKRLPDAFKVPEILAESLYNQSFYIRACDMWRDAYFAIHKRSKSKFNPKMLKSLNVKNLESNLAAIALRQVGEPEVLSMIQAERRKGSLTKIQAQRLKAKVRRLSTLPNLIEPDESLRELDGKIRQAVQCYR